MRHVNNYIEALKQGNLDEVNKEEQMMTSIIERLNSEDASCVIANGDVVRSFNLRGVADLYQLMQDEPDFLRGAIMADKVVGKGAAAIMMHCGVKRMHTRVISEAALEFIFNESRMVVEYDKRVSYIMNRSKDGWCPLETRCKEETKVDKMIPIIDNFIKDMKNANK